MSELRFATYDVFTDRAYSGNPLAVVFGGDTLKTPQMQRIAREFNLSETVFVLGASGDGAVRLRIFTPLQELPFAGHPIIGAACAIAEMGLVPEGNEASFRFETGSGPVTVRIRRASGSATYAELAVERAPLFGNAAADPAALARALGLLASDLAYGAETPRVVSGGLAFLLVPLRVPELLAGITLDASALPALLADYGAHSLYVYARGYEEGELRARMFSPGIGEDPATGSAAVALGLRLAAEAASGGAQAWTIHQGVEMGRASRLHLRVEAGGDDLWCAQVGGHAVPVMQGQLRAY